MTEQPPDRVPDDARADVTAHYARHGGLTERILAAVREAGLDPRDAEALQPIDQFHLGGPEATRALAERVGIRDAAVLDVGCGIGGPARMLARAFGCGVTGLDLTESYCATAAALSRTVGLADSTRFVCASAHALPFADGAWPWVWTQHAAMNIPDKPRMYAEIARVLAPGGRFVLYDIVAGPVREPRFPVPWAATPSASFLLPGNAVHRRVLDAGLREVFWHDKTAEAVQNVRAARARRQTGQPEGLGPQTIMGPEFLDMRRNLARNLEEGRVGVVQAMFEKPA